MKSFALVLVFAQVAIFQSYAQILRPAPFLPSPILPSPCGCGAPLLPPVLAGPSVIASPPVLASPPVIAASPQLLPALLPSSVSLVPSNSVANNLVDTLSLLTVSSLLAESLPYGYPNVVSLPAVSSYPSCGCGGYPYYF